MLVVAFAALRTWRADRNLTILYVKNFPWFERASLLRKMLNPRWDEKAGLLSGMR